MSFWHVDAGWSRAGGDDQGRAQEIQLDRDVAGHGAVMVAHLNLDRTGEKVLSVTWWTMELKTQRIQVIVSLNTEDGPYCEVEGQTGLEVLCRVFEGQDVRRLHDFDASLLGFNQIAACRGGETNRVSSWHLGLFDTLDTFKMDLLQFMKGNSRLFFSYGVKIHIFWCSVLLFVPLIFGIARRQARVPHFPKADTQDSQCFWVCSECEGHVIHIWPQAAFQKWDCLHEPSICPVQRAKKLLTVWLQHFWKILVLQATRNKSNTVDWVSATCFEIMWQLLVKSERYDYDTLILLMEWRLASCYRSSFPTDMKVLPVLVRTEALT